MKSQHNTQSSTDQIRDVVPQLAELTDRVLFGEIWERPILSPRDRSLITLGTLISLNRIDQLPSHFTRAVNNGITQAEIFEMITHLAFYSGWPTAMSAALAAKQHFAPEDEEHRVPQRP